MNRKHRKLRHKRRVEASKPGVPKEDKRIALLSECLLAAKRARKGRAYVVKLMAQHGYVIEDDADHRNITSWRTLPQPKPALVKS